MKGIVVSAGKGTRLGVPCKALVEVHGKPLISYPLDTLKKSGISEVIIIQFENQISEILGDEYNGMKLKYVSQNERKGIAHAISLTEELVDGDSMAIILGDIIYDGDLKKMIDAFNYQLIFDFVVGVMPVEDKNLIRNSYGVTQDFKYIEKPQEVNGLLGLLGTGLYIASNRVFDIFRHQSPSARGELEITDSLNIGKTCPIILSGKYININTPEDLEGA